MSRVKTFDSTGVATAGRLYAGDLNLIQDQYADLVNYAQTHGVGLIAVGDSSLQLLKYGAGEMRLTGHVRTDGILRALGGLFGGTFTTAQRNAIPAGSRPHGLMIINTDTVRPEWNAGTDATPNWQPIGITTIPPDSITATELANLSVGQSELAANAVIASKVDGSLKPSVSAAAATEALRALGTTGATAAAGNDARLSDQRTPTDASVTLAKLAAALKPSGTAAAGDEAVRAIGAGASQVVAGNDPRLTDQRTPPDNSVTAAKIVDGQVGNAELGANVVTPAKAKIDSAETWNFLGILQSKSMRTHRHPYGNDRHVESGEVTAGSLQNDTGNQLLGSVTFTDAFAVAPRVTLGGSTNSGGLYSVYYDSLSTTGVTIRCYNQFNGNTGSSSWIAEGQD